MNQECRKFHSRLQKFLNVMQYASNVYLIHRSFSATSVTALCHCGNIVNPPAHKLVLPTILWNWYAWLSMPRRCTIRHRPLCWEHANSGKKFLEISSIPTAYSRELWINWRVRRRNIDGFLQDCNISIANALELLQSCTKPSIWCDYAGHWDDC